MSRVILHVDMDAFFASIEQLDNPAWKGLPVIVGAAPDKRGVVAAASYEARQFGIRSAMPSCEAGRRCPHGIFTPPRMARYAEVSSRIMTLLGRFTPMVEPLSIDEAFLDVSGAQRLFGSGPEIGRLLKDAIRHEIGLTASVGVAANKFLAKLASDLEKPDGLTVIPTDPDQVRVMLAPLPVTRLWGIGAKSAAVLEHHAIRTVGDIQATPTAALARWLGSAAALHFRELAFGRDDRALVIESTPKTISREHTFPEDCDAPDAIRSVLLELTEDVGRRLRRQQRYAHWAVLKIRWRGFETRTRRHMFPRAVDDDFALRRAAGGLLQEADLTRPVRLIGFGVGLLSGSSATQMDLFAPVAGDEREQRVCHAVDALRQRLGPRSVRRGTSMTLPNSEEG